MKKTLDELTIGQFVDLVCGEFGVLGAAHEMIAPVKAATVMRNIVLEYKEIADPAGVKSFISESEDFLKAKMEYIIYGICNNLIQLKEYGRVKLILEDCGVNAERMSAARLTAEVKSRLMKAKRAMDEHEETGEDGKEENPRRMFDEQTAAMMAYYKFQIHMNTMKATVYAHLVARMAREIKARQAALKK